MCCGDSAVLCFAGVTGSMNRAVLTVLREPSCAVLIRLRELSRVAVKALCYDDCTVLNVSC